MQLETLFKQILINSLENGYNQRSALEVPKGVLVLDDLPNLCKVLGELLREHYECTTDCIAHVCEDGSWSIYAQDFWDEGEHPSGHRDRLVLSLAD